MQKILFSALAIFAVVAMAGVGSWALWSDTETSNNNVITAGSLDLELSGDVPMTVGNVSPGDSGTMGTVTATNVGSINGVLSLTLDALDNYENTCVEPEDGDTTCGLSNTAGELDQYTSVSFAVGGTTVAGPYLLSTVTAGDSLGTLPLAAADSITVDVLYSVDSAAPNTTMTDSIEMDLTAKLDQA